MQKCQTSVTEQHFPHTTTTTHHHHRHLLPTGLLGFEFLGVSWACNLDMWRSAFGVRQTGMSAVCMSVVGTGWMDGLYYVRPHFSVLGSRFWRGGEG